MKEPLQADQEAQAHRLAHDIAQAAHDEFLQIARILVAAADTTLFGANDFTVRDLALQVAAKAYQQRLAQKKTRTASLTGR